MWKRIKSVITINKQPELTTLFSTTNSGFLTEYQKAFSAPPTAYSEKYPHIPKPKALTEPELLAARWASGEIYPEKMPGIAADLLEAGLDSPSMRRLAGEMHVQCLADVGQLAERMFRELGVEVPSSDTEAKYIVTCQIAREVIAGMRNPWQAAADLSSVWSYDMWRHEHLGVILQLFEDLNAGIARGELAEKTRELIALFATVAA